MARTAADIAIGITADIGPLLRETGRAKAALTGLSGATDRMSAGLEGFGSRMAGIGARLSIVSVAMGAAGTAAFKLASSAAAAGDKVYNASRAAGVSAGYFQEMAFAVGAVADVTEEEFGAALTKLNRKLGEAKGGSESAIAAFEAVGISQADIASGAINTEAAMNAVIAKLGEIKDPAIAAAVSTALFGKSGAALGGQLMGASGEVATLRDRARELGIVMSDEAVNAGDQFGDAMGELSKSFELVKIKIANVLLPILVNELIPVMVEKVIPAIGQVVEKIGGWLTAFQGLPGPVQEAVGIIAGLFAVGGPLLVGIGLVSSVLGGLVAASGPVGLFIAAATLAYVAWQTWGDDIKKAIGPGIEWITGKFDAVVAKLQTVIDKAVEIKTAIADALNFSDDPNFQGSVQSGGAGLSRPLDSSDPANAGLYGTGVDLGNGLAAGLTSTQEANRAAVGAMIDSITQTARDKLQVQSPSRVFMEIGDYVGQGLANGIAANSGMVNAAVGTLTTGAVNSTQGMVSSVLGSLGQMFQGSKGIAAAQALVNAWAGATEALKLPFPANLSAFASVLATGFNAVKSIKSATVGGGGGGASPSAAVAGTSSGGAAAPAAVQPSQIINISMTGEKVGRAGVGALIGQINDGLRQGYRIERIGFEA